MEQIKDIRVFTAGGMNLDVSPELLTASEYREAWNILVSSPEGGAMGCAVNVKGTTSIFDLPINSGLSLPNGTFKGIGACSDINRNAIVFMLMDTSKNKNHSVIRFYPVTKKVEFILKSQSSLNFVKPFRPFIIDDLLCWADGYEKVPFVDFNPPFAFNITRAVGLTNLYDINYEYHTGDYAGYGGKTYQWTWALPGKSVPPTNSKYWTIADKYSYGAITSDNIKRIKPCPNTQPIAAYDQDITFLRNSLRGYLFRFAIRWIYADNEKSVFSSWSDIPFPQGEEYADGGYINNTTLDITVNNVIKVGIDTGGDQVIACEVAAVQGDMAEIEGNLPTWQMVYRLDKFNEYGDRLVADNISVNYSFYNDVAGLPLDPSDFYRLMDFVPQVSGYETIVESNRILDNNYTEGFDNIDINASFKVINGVIVNDRAKVLDGVYYPPDINTPLPAHVDVTFPSYIPAGTVVSAVIYRWTHLYNDPNNYDYGTTTNAQRFQCDIIVAQGETTDKIVGRLGAMINTKVASNYNYNGVIQKLYYPNPYAPFVLQLIYNTVLMYYPDLMAADRYFINLFTVYVIPVINKTQSFKSGSQQNFGIEYANDDMQLTTVQKNGTCRVFVPYNTYPTPLSNLIQWSVYHRPPMWAKQWRWVWGGSNIEYALQLNVPFNITNNIPNHDPSVPYLANIIDDNLHTKIPFNQTILDTKDEFPIFNIKNYIWQKGDRIRIFAIEGIQNSNVYWYGDKGVDYEILAIEYLRGADDYLQDTSGVTDPYIVDNYGNKIYDTGKAYLVINILNRIDYGLPNVLSDLRQVIWEVYRPSRVTQGNAVSKYNECGDWYGVLEPHTPNRRHGGATTNQNSTLTRPATGTFTFGDCYVKQRITSTASFSVEAAEFSDYFDSKVVSVGRPNVYDPNARRVNYFSNLLYGGKKIENTNVNELSKVLSSDHISLRQDFGAIAYAVETGFTLNVVQRSKQTSFYVGREGLQQASAINPELISASSKVLSVPIVGEDDYGTIFTGVKYERDYYIYDIYRGCIVRHSPNGNREISSLYDEQGKPHGIKDFLTKRSDLYITDGIENISFNAAYDDKNGIVLFSFKDSVTPALDMTLGFHEKSNMWIAFYNFNPDVYGYEGNALVYFDLQKLWLCNDNPVRNNFSGTQYSSFVKIVSNKVATAVKRFISIFINSNKKWSAPNAGDISIPASGNNPNGMVSLLKDGAFTAVEGKWKADFGKNMTTNQATPEIKDLINGEELRGQYMEANLQNNDTTEVKLFAVEVDGVTSS